MSLFLLSYQVINATTQHEPDQKPPHHITQDNMNHHILHHNMNYITSYIITTTRKYYIMQTALPQLLQITHHTIAHHTTPQHTTAQHTTAHQGHTCIHQSTTRSPAGVLLAILCTEYRCGKQVWQTADICATVARSCLQYFTASRPVSRVHHSFAYQS